MQQIGRFTAITVSSNALINNYYNGKLYSFLLAKEGVEIKILKLAETDTDEVNGMQVTVLNRENSRLSVCTHARVTITSQLTTILLYILWNMEIFLCL